MATLKAAKFVLNKGIFPKNLIICSDSQAVIESLAYFLSISVFHKETLLRSRQKVIRIFDLLLSRILDIKFAAITKFNLDSEWYSIGNVLDWKVKAYYHNGRYLPLICCDKAQP